MRRADRLLDIIQALRRHRKPVAGTVLAKDLEVSLRTLYRDMATLIAQGVPIAGEAGVGYVLQDGYDLPPLMFAAEELEAIVLGLRWVAGHGDQGLSLAAKNSHAKIASVLPKPLKDQFYESPLLAPPRVLRNPDGCDMAEVRAAIRRHKKIDILYHDERGEISERRLWPFAIGYFEHSRVIAAYCELRADFRHFRSDRIENLLVTEYPVPETRRKLLKRWSETALKNKADYDPTFFH